MRWLPFQLNPDVPDEGIPRQEYLARKFGPGHAHSYARVAGVGKDVGIEFAFVRITVQPNTLHAHRLMRYGAKAGREDEVAEQLFRAYFLEGANPHRPGGAGARRRTRRSRSRGPGRLPGVRGGAGRACCGPTAKPGRPASTGCHASSSITAPRCPARRRLRRSSRQCWMPDRGRSVGSPSSIGPRGGLFRALPSPPIEWSTLKVGPGPTLLPG